MRIGLLQIETGLQGVQRRRILHIPKCLWIFHVARRSDGSQATSEFLDMLQLMLEVVLDVVECGHAVGVGCTVWSRSVLGDLAFLRGGVQRPIREGIGG